MKIDVGFIFLRQILKGMRIGHPLGALTNGLAVHLGSPLRRKPRGMGFLQAPEFEIVRRDTRLVLHHPRQRLHQRRQELRDARSRLSRHKQPAPGKHVQRFAQGGTRDAQPFGEFALAQQPLPWAQDAFKDHAFEAAGNRFGNPWRTDGIKHSCIPCVLNRTHANVGGGSRI